ncbi:uncharacterized protein LOC121039607 isoform X5 [Herpailurus yagouaroundi]|uniref:uncharacterized protein LOC121039607 isoform X5 n=1 Tax=Herpailurus yagouaroundi TaxID=1608482 RepID=UPI001AD62CBB|nr:uncharacterized protein LOC121039607 isoform X5 [Puma yagouaroundi]XP_040345754.1 uncharacterized protein LOC121039607 isoform X5 [Puma yagouaroundi]XP_040345755.1 uncharacterized protein LOC121039607 isoform X5 [Puma yagouaroundi]XP_040345756.1 uncharacterized protein LOC121039607 isoform X5 [Puma yagouaroundi]XP_040345757.1 uncharacterized protein LOC121039607 isoform X5 [Puma yagouaroundi]XP_040345758.1 uncharacterized protein LOC121039607 isoform X5 [Puma yagouaroundi]XP_040345759.1 un
MQPSTPRGSPLERPEPEECGRGTTPFQGLWSQKKLARLAEPRFLHRPPTPDLLTPNRPDHTCTGPPVGGTHREEAVQSSPSTCLVLGTDRDVHRDPVAPSAYRQVRTATWVTSCDPRASGRWEAFGTLSSVTMRLLQVVLAAVFIIFQVLPAATRAFNFERPCYLRGGICLKQGTPDCEPFRGPCRAFTVCCKVKGLWGRAAAEKP